MAESHTSDEACGYRAFVVVSVPGVVGYALGTGIEVVAAFLFPAVSDDPVPAAATGPAGAEATATPPASKATFELYGDRKSEYRWRLRHRNGNVVAGGGEGYSSKQKAKKGIDAVQRTASDAGVVER